MHVFQHAGKYKGQILQMKGELVVMTAQLQAKLVLLKVQLQNLIPLGTALINYSFRKQFYLH